MKKNVFKNDKKNATPGEKKHLLSGKKKDEALNVLKKVRGIFPKCVNRKKRNTTVQPLAGCSGYDRVKLHPAVLHYGDTDFKALLDGNKFLEAGKQVFEYETTNSISADSLYDDIFRRMWKVVEGFLYGSLDASQSQPLMQVVDAVKWEKSMRRDLLERSVDSDGGVRWSHKEWESELVGCLQKAMKAYIPSFHPGKRTLSEQLYHMENIIDCNVGKNGPFLKEVGFLTFYVKCFDDCILDHLHTLLKDCNEYRECALLYIWVTKSYIRKMMGSPDLHEQTLEALDPLLHSKWILKAQEKFLACVRDWRRARLNRILQSELNALTRQIPCENFLEIFLVLTTTVEDIEEMGDFIVCEVQAACWEDIQWFIKRYAEDLKTALQQKAQNLASVPNIEGRILRNCQRLRATCRNLAVRYPLPKETRETLEELIENTEFQGAEYFLASRLPEIKNHFTSNCMDIHWVVEHLEHELEVLDLMQCQYFVKAVHHRVCVECLRACLLTSQTLCFANNKETTSTFIKDGEQLQNVFQKILAPTTTPLINPIESVAAILQVKDFEALKLYVLDFINIHQDVREEHLCAIMDIKASVGRKERQDIVQLLQIRTAQTKESQFLFFEEISMKKRSSWFCICCC